MDELKNNIEKILCWAYDNGLRKEPLPSIYVDQIISLFHGSKSYPNEYKIFTSKQTVNLEEYIKASQNDGL